MHSIALSHMTATGHRIPNHDNGMGKCARLHGHQYKFKIHLAAETIDPETGFIVDFSSVKKILDEWDHRTLLWVNDPLVISFPVVTADPNDPVLVAMDETYGIVRVPFIPTAENMAQALARRFVLDFDTVHFAQVHVFETPTSEASYYCSTFDAQREASYGGTI